MLLNAVQAIKLQNTSIAVEAYCNNLFGSARLGNSIKTTLRTCEHGTSGGKVSVGIICTNVLKIQPFHVFV